MSGDKLRDIEERLQAATPGPWRVSNSHGLCVRGGGDSMVADLEQVEFYNDAASAGADATLIAHAPSDLAWLLRIARAAERLAQCANYYDDDDGCNYQCGAKFDRGGRAECPNCALRRALEGDADGK